jgi:NAD(P)-dependent dehydrogenase (short-subunit alcohol dehydrogenase family)
MEKANIMKKGVQSFDVSSKTALITGATGYLGSAMAIVLAEAGAHILVNSRSQKRSEALVQILKNAGHTAKSAVFDITDQKNMDRFFREWQDSPLHILINNAYNGGVGCIELSKAEDYTKSYDVTVLASHNLLNTALPSLRKAVRQSGDASVINIASMYAMISPDQRIYESMQGVNPPFYGAAKAALLQWTRYAACEFGVEGIRVNSISPGPFPSREVQSNEPDFIRKLANKVPLGRIGKAEEIKGPTLFLASSASSFVNGSNIVVDGGWTCW